MAGNRHVHSEDRGKVRVRFMDIEIEGANQTLLEGIREITSAMPAQVVIRQVPAKTTPKTLASAPATTDADQEAEEVEADDLVPEAEEPVQTRAPSSGLRKPRSSPKPPALATHLRLDESPTLADFAQRAGMPKDASDMKRAIVVASWLKETRGQDTLDASEFYTCCKHAGWTPPSDVTSPMRNLKRQQEMDSKEPGKWFLTVLGEKQFLSMKNGS